MKIGFNLAAISENLENYELVKDVKKYPGKVYVDARKVLEKLKEEEHEIYLFAETKEDLDIEKTKELKKQIKINLRKNNIPYSNFTIVKDSDVINVAKRNRIDIFVNDDKKETNDIKEFTDAINYNKNEKVDLMEEINKSIEENRKPMMSPDKEATDSPSKDELWLKNYRVGDFKWTKENMSPYDRLKTSTVDFMDETRLEVEGKEMNGAEFFKKVDEGADCLMNVGIKKGVKVPIIVANTPESIILLYSLLKVKATVIPIFPKIKPQDLKQKLIEIDYKHIFVTDLLYGKLKEVIPEDKTTVIMKASKSLPKVKGFLLENVVKRKNHIKPIEFGDKVISLEKFTEENNKNHYDIDTSYDDSYPAVQLYTGGSIRTKRVLLSEKNIDAATKSYLNDRLNIKRKDVTAAFLPLNHVFGLIITTHALSVLGTKISLIMKINFDKIDKIFLKNKITIFAGIPTMFSSIIDNKKLRKADLKDVNLVLSGGSKLSSIEREKSEKFYKNHNSKAKVIDGYGKTETTGGILVNGIPNIGTGVKIVEPGTEIELGYDQIGELCVSGDQVFMKYLEEDVNEKALRVHSDGILWHHTEDTAYITKDGVVKIIDRLDRMIKVNGEQVHLNEIEEIINNVNFVEKSVVVKKLDKIRGEVPAAYVKLKPNYKWCDEIEEELARIYEEKLPHYSIPKFTESINEVPMTEMGKVDFKSLEREANLHEGKVLKKSLY